MEKMRAIRGGHRSAVTRLINRTKEKIAENNIEIQELSAAIDTLLKKMTLLKNLDIQILDGTEVGDMESEILDSDEFNLHLEVSIHKFKDITSNSGVTIRFKNTMKAEHPYEGPVDHEKIHSILCEHQIKLLPKEEKGLEKLRGEIYRIVKGRKNLKVTFYLHNVGAVIITENDVVENELLVEFEEDGKINHVWTSQKKKSIVENTMEFCSDLAYKILVKFSDIIVVTEVKALYDWLKATYIVKYFVAAAP
ncbi:uncharacterized protein [Mytilus edulis]|uniref:uncharacterized protein n=1 Tax=Mytilus edulis TaxID=6550 RepID=UPI0039EF36E6